MNLEVNGTRLWFDVDGPALVPEGSTMCDRPTIVLLHGGPGSYDHSYFKPDFARLADDAQVVYLDLRGHGRSEWGEPADWSIEGCADDLRAFCDALSIRQPIIYGHSLGGFVAMVLAARHPHCPGALVLQSTNARFDLERIVDGLRRAGGDGVAATAERVYGGSGQDVTDEEWDRCFRLLGPWVPGLEEQSRKIVNRDLGPRGFDLMRAFDVRDELARVECRTLVCVGELDPVTPVAAAREIIDSLPAGKAELVVIEGAGHFTWRDAPDTYWPILTEFVRTAA